MGNSSNKNAASEDHIEHERLGPVKLQQKPADSYSQEEEQDTFYMHLTRSVESQKIYNEWLKSMEQIKDSEVKEILLLPQKHSFETVGLCGSGGVVKLTFDYYQFVLKTEILNRSKLKKDFLQTQIWYLLFNIVRAGKKFQHQKRKIGNVHPNNILINESGQIKVISTSSLPGELNNYDYLIQNQANVESCVYLAPQQINADLMQKGTYPTHVDPCLAEVFSIGLTILASGTLEDCDKIYQKQPYKLNSDRLNSYLKQFSQKYSPFLYQTVLSMVALDPSLRKKSSQIYRILSEYEAQIMDLQPFQVQNYRPPQRSSNQGYVYQQQIPNNYRQQIVSQIPQQQIYYNAPPPNFVQAQPNVIYNSGQRGQPLYHRQ